MSYGPFFNFIFFFAKCLHVGEDGPGRGQLCHTDTFLVYFSILQIWYVEVPIPLSIFESLGLQDNMFKEQKVKTTGQFGWPIQIRSLGKATLMSTATYKLRIHTQKRYFGYTVPSAMENQSILFNS